MPDYFTHVIAADLIREKLPQDKRRLLEPRELYILGAQGGDVFFAYNLKFSKGNLGRNIHKIPAKELFEKLLKGNKAYLAGFATHYALDSVVHPLVYAYADTHAKQPFAHIKFEKDIGLYASKFFRLRRTILPRDKVLSCTGILYDSLKPVLPQITVTGVERCLKRHFDYTRYLLRTKKQNYKCSYDFSIFSGVLSEAIDFGVKCVESVLENEVDEKLFCREFLQR